jgi:hypothetical protein
MFVGSHIHQGTGLPVLPWNSTTKTNECTVSPQLRNEHQCCCPDAKRCLAPIKGKSCSTTPRHCLRSHRRRCVLPSDQDVRHPRCPLRDPMRQQVLLLSRRQALPHPREPRYILHRRRHPGLLRDRPGVLPPDRRVRQCWRGVRPSVIRDADRRCLVAQPGGGHLANKRPKTAKKELAGR